MTTPNDSIAKNQSAQKRTGRFHGVSRNRIELKYLPQPDYIEYQIPATHQTLITNDGSGLAAQLEKQIRSEGGHVSILNLPGVANPIRDNAVTLTEITDATIKAALDMVRNQHGPIGQFIHLHPHFEFTKPNFTEHFSADKSIVKALFFLAKHLKQDLNDLGQKQRASFLTVTRLDGQMGHGDRGNISVVGGGIPGLVKCLNLEWSPVYCRAIDLQPELSVERMGTQIIRELHDVNKGIIEVGFSDQGRQTTSVVPDPVVDDREVQSTITADSVFLVSGGARGVTSNCVIEMARAFQCKFILLGRSEASYTIPAFAEKEDNEAILKRLIMSDLKEKGKKPSLPLVKKIYNQIVAQKEIEATIRQITAHGSSVEYLQGDVTDVRTFKPALSEISRRFGDVTGIIHGAGRLADKYIQDKTEADFENVLSVKLDGLLSLLSAVNLHQLEHLILFSSVAGFYGNVGQSDYAIANEILSRAAHLFKTNHPKTHVSAINWGAWDSGMVSGELKAQFEAAGVSLVNSEGGASMLVNELNSEYSDQPQVIIGGTLPAGISHLGDICTHRVRRKLKATDNPFLMHHVIQGKAVLPVVNAVGWMAQTCEKLYPDYVVSQVESTQLFKGIVFDGSEKEEYILELKELEKDEKSIRFEATVMSEGGKLPTYHYKSKVVITNKKALPEPPKFEHHVNASFAVEDGSKLYEDGSLFHGKYFQGIDQILDCNENSIVLACHAPDVPLSEQGQFPVGSINTYFSDIQYQGMVVWVQRFHAGAKSLPLQTESAVIYKNIPFDKRFFVHAKIQESTDYKMVANCTVYDEEGTVYMQTDGAAVTVSKQLVW